MRYYLWHREACVEHYDTGSESGEYETDIGPKKREKMMSYGRSPSAGQVKLFDPVESGQIVSPLVRLAEPHDILQMIQISILGSKETLTSAQLVNHTHSSL